MQMCVFFSPPPPQERYRWASSVTLYIQPSLCLLMVKRHWCAISALCVWWHCDWEAKKNQKLYSHLSNFVPLLPYSYSARFLFYAHFNFFLIVHKHGSWFFSRHDSVSQVDSHRRWGRRRSRLFEPVAGQRDGRDPGAELWRDQRSATTDHRRSLNDTKQVKKRTPNC